MRVLQKLLFLLAIPAFSFGQSLSLDSCQMKARNNYPLLKQYGLIEKTSDYNLSNASKAYLPQFSLAVKATYRSDVTKIPTMLTDVLSQMSGQPVSFPSLSKDQYQAVVELNQLIWDGGLTKAQKKSIKANSEADKQKLEVDLYALNDRINNLFFGIMLINEQLKQNDILKQELSTNYKKVEAYIQNGVAQQSDLDAIKVEQINAGQHETDLKSARKSYLQMLSAFIGKQIDENTRLEKPVLPEANIEVENKRPEVQFFAAQEKSLEAQRSAVYAANLPKIGIFAQGGYGRPGLNMFDAEFSTFYIGGIRLSWNLSGFYTQKNNLNKIETGKKTIEVQKETFLFNNNLATRQQQNDIDKLKATLTNDDEIIGLRTNIKKAAEAKVANGTLTVSDLLREIDAESLARQTKALHEIQLYMTTYQLKNNINN
ncbi:MAG: TolC family protein [Paludibacter sp.]|nr:TolC family protein [Paludibacter sp.]